MNYPDNPSVPRKMADKGCKVSEYIVRQILEQLGFRHRSFAKDLPMKDVKDRDAQFLNIAEILEKAAGVKLPIISIDTKKKELIGNFKQERQKNMSPVLSVIVFTTAARNATSIFSISLNSNTLSFLSKR